MYGFHLLPRALLGSVSVLVGFGLLYLEWVFVSSENVLFTLGRFSFGVGTLRWESVWKPFVWVSVECLPRLRGFSFVGVVWTIVT